MPEWFSHSFTQVPLPCPLQCRQGANTASAPCAEALAPTKQFIKTKKNFRFVFFFVPLQHETVNRLVAVLHNKSRKEESPGNTGHPAF